MTIAYWHSEYCTGNSLIDQQHQDLFVIINSLHNAMMEGHGKNQIKKTLQELLDYTIEHFATEEKLMLESNYPHYREHKRKHDELANKVSSLAEEFNEGNVLLNAELLQFLGEWLIHHIKGEDLNMINFLRHKNQLPTSDYSRIKYNQAALAKIQEAQNLIKKLKKSLES